MSLEPIIHSPALLSKINLKANLLPEKYILMEEATPNPYTANSKQKNHNLRILRTPTATKSWSLMTPSPTWDPSRARVTLRLVRSKMSRSQKLLLLRCKNHFHRLYNCLKGNREWDFWMNNKNQKWVKYLKYPTKKKRYNLKKVNKTHK